MVGLEKKRKFIINVIYFSMILGLFYVFMKYAFWLMFPFLFAFFVAIILQKPVRKIVSKTPIKKGLASTICVILALAVVAVIVLLIGAKLASELNGLLKALDAQMQNFPQFIKTIETKLIDMVRFLPDTVEQKAAEGIRDFSQRIMSSEAGISINWSFLSSPLKGVLSKAKQIPVAFAGTVVTIVSCCFMTADYDRISGFIMRQFSPEHRNGLRTAKRIMFSSMGKMIKAYAIIIFITFAEMTIGLSFLKLVRLYSGGYIIAISLIVAIVDIVPVLGTGTILIPWAIYSLIVGDFGFAIGLIVVYALISIIRQVVEPKLVAGQLGLPSVVTIIGMFIGVRLFGFIGIFIVPLTVILIKLLNDEGVIHVWNRPCDVEKKETETSTDKPAQK